ncbi:MAG: zinc-dependent alcohol dehydrogenase family protein [Planctomycetaceae bacterium]|nr:zinc-dependent alcohol dehydrogenase family protein [Planctomycetaceae bacterium]
MHAVRVESFGEPAEVAKAQDVSDVAAGAGQAVIRMLRAPVNPSDLMTIRGTYTVRPKLPFTPGYEGVGIVEQAPGLMGRLFLGKRVVVLQSQTGTWGERAVAPIRSLIPVPRDMSDEQAAMFFVNPATAYLLTREVLSLGNEDWLLQSAATSAVGRAVIRLGRKFGFRTINLVRRESDVEPLRQLGADRVVVVNDSPIFREQLQPIVAECCGTAGLKAAIDPVGGETGTAAASVLGNGGRLVLYGSLTDQPISVDPRHLLTVGATISSFWLGRTMAERSLLSKLKLIRALTNLHREGVFETDVAANYSLSDVAQACKHAEQPGKRGKVILRCDSTK